MAARMTHLSGREPLPETMPSSGSMPTFRVETWGCQMNVLDSHRLAGQLESRGFRPVGRAEIEDVILLNTCAIREKAQTKVYSALGILGQRKRDNPDLVIGVTGCLAQMEGAEIFERAPWVDFVAGPGEVERVGDLVQEIRRDRRRVQALELPTDSPVYQFREISRDSRFSAFLTVIEGCDQFCTFCIVPFTRGRERSRHALEILHEAESLAARGYSEITLLGQTVNAYRDPEKGFGLGRLLERVAEISGIRRLRFITSHPSFVDEEMVQAIAKGGNIAPYLHLPAQSGSSRVLYRMKRRYDRAGYLDAVGRVRRSLPDVAISSDFIVGFPGETDADFEETLSLIREVRFANVFAFVYSPRPGTASARWGREQSVPADVSAERLARLLALQEEIQAEENRSLVGRVMEILVEGANAKGQSRGRTRCNRVVHIDGNDEGTAPGSYVMARITRGLPNSLIATIPA
jgi:tRNA-2-methylthio-N6-dimethylallyladenosine synthase